MGLEAQCARLVASCGKNTDRKQGWTFTLTVSFFYTDDWWHVFYQPQKICSKDAAVEVWLGRFVVLLCKVTLMSRQLAVWQPGFGTDSDFLHQQKRKSSCVAMNFLIETLPRIIWSDLGLWITCSALWLKMSDCSSSLKRCMFKAAEVILLFHLNTCSKFYLLQPHRSCMCIVLASAVVWLGLADMQVLQMTELVDFCHLLQIYISSLW